MSAMSAAASSVATPTLDFRGASNAAASLNRVWEKVHSHHRAPLSLEPLEQTFHGLVATWKEEREFTSSMSAMVLAPSYQRIIGLGPPAVPLILRELAKKPDHWFWALTAITGVNPIPPDGEGNMSQMTAVWIQWGKQHKLLK